MLSPGVTLIGSVGISKVALYGATMANVVIWASLSRLD